MSTTPTCSSNAARVQGAGPNTGAGDPIDVNVISTVGGPVTIADCADVTQGCIADAKVQGDSAGTISAKLRGLLAYFSLITASVNSNLNGVVLGQLASVIRLYQSVSGNGVTWNAARTDGLMLSEGVGAVAMSILDIAAASYSPVANISSVPDNTNGISVLGTSGIAQVSSGAVKAFSKLRTPDRFNTVQANAAGNTALWTPAAGKSFRLMRYMVAVTGDAATAGGAVVTVSLNDAGGAIGQAHDIFIPNAAPAAPFGTLYVSPWVDLGNGVASGAPNNVLNVNLSAALTAGKVRVICVGTED